MQSCRNQPFTPSLTASVVSRDLGFWVTSSCLCKKVEGAGFPFQVKSLEDGIDDAIHTFYVHKTHHGSGAAADFDKAALDHGAPSSVDAAPADRPCESPPPSRHNHR